MIGIFGGTFDPIHYGHLRPALDVQQALDLDEVRFVPLRDPPHRDGPNTMPDDRLAMVRTAVADEPRFSVDERELRRESKSYTLLTLQSLRAELGPDMPLCLMLGTDAFRGFPTWHKPSEILKLTHLVVMQRPGETRPDYYAERVINDPTALRAAPAGQILFQPVTQLEISATAIRALIAADRSPRYLLPQPVLDIIQQRGLYR